MTSGKSELRECKRLQAKAAAQSRQLKTQSPKLSPHSPPDPDSELLRSVNPKPGAGAVHSAEVIFTDPGPVGFLPAPETIGELLAKPLPRGSIVPFQDCLIGF